MLTKGYKIAKTTTQLTVIDPNETIVLQASRPQDQTSLFKLKLVESRALSLATLSPVETHQRLGHAH